MYDTIAIINQERLITCEKAPDLLSQLDNKKITFTLDSGLKSHPRSLSACQVDPFESRQLKFCYAPSKVT